MSAYVKPILFQKKIARPLLLEINAEKRDSLERSSQNTYYLNQFQKFGLAPGYRLLPTSSIADTQSPLEYQLQSITDPTDIIDKSQLTGIYAFVILEEQGQLNLRLGKMSHWFVAKKTQFVKAAGDIYFSEGIITKVTDQSGGYCIDKQDPDIEAKKASVRHHIEAVGLPMDKFKPFMERMQKLVNSL